MNNYVDVVFIFLNFYTLRVVANSLNKKCIFALIDYQMFAILLFIWYDSQ